MIEEIKNIDMIGILTNNFSKKVYWSHRQMEAIRAKTSRMLDYDI